MKSKSTLSDLDRFPTSLLNDCLDVLIEPITSIIDKSLQEGVKLQSSFTQFYSKDIGESCRISPTFPHGIKFDV